jgi:pre-rRNA-processing protein RIX1
MASSQRRDPAVTVLRALAFRLSSTSPSNLPSLLPHLASQLRPCKELLKQSQPSHSEAATVIHQIRTRTSSLLQDRSPEARLAAVVLIKALVEAGGYETLANNGSPWVRGLIAMIARQDSTANATKKLSIITVTRIIVVAKDHDTLAREIATPNVPPFVNSCLTVFEGVKGNWGPRQRALIETVLRSWVQLIPRHPATFRPFIGRILKVLTDVIEVPAEENEGTRGIWKEEVKDAARSVYIVLHNSATKAASLADRDAGFAQALENASKAANETFVAVFGHDKAQIQIQAAPTEISIKNAEEICNHIHFVRAYITTPSFKPVSIPIGKIASLLQRISTPPSARQSSSSVSKRSREQFLIDLPQIHLAVLDLVTALIMRFGSIALPISLQLLDVILSIFESHIENPVLRTACYNAMSHLSSLIGPGMSLEQCNILAPLIYQLTTDLLPTPPSTVTTTASASTTKPTTTPHPSMIPTTLHAKSISNSSPPSPLNTASTALLPLLLRHLPTKNLPRSLRAALDRAAILTQHPTSLATSALNPASDAEASLLPIAVRCRGAREALEGLVRPRFPSLVGLARREKEKEKAEEKGAEQEESVGREGGGWFRDEDEKARERFGVRVGAEDEEMDDARGEEAPEIETSTEKDGAQVLETLKKVNHDIVRLNERGIKHTLPEDDDTTFTITSPPKRVRLLENMEPATTQSVALPVVEQDTGNVRSYMPHVSKVEADSEDDAGSDFEVPTLVLAGAQADDEEDK